MQNKTLQDPNSRFITPAGGVIALFCFFMPWVKASCMGNTISNASGFDLATKNGGDLILVALIAAVAIIGISFYMLVQQTPWKSKLPVFISSGIGIGCLWVSLFKGGRPSSGGLEVTLQFGAFGTIIGFIISIIGVWVTSKSDGSSGTPGENQYVPNPKAESHLSAAEQMAEAAYQAAANAPQPTHLAQPMPPVTHQAAANASQPAPFRCLLEGQDTTGRPFALTISELALGDRAGVTLGRSPANAEFIIDHQEVSREHVRLACADGELYAEDLNALNGTKVNGRLLNPREQVLLRDNDRFEIGPVIFTVRLV